MKNDNNMYMKYQNMIRECSGNIRKYLMHHPCGGQGGIYSPRPFGFFLTIIQKM